MKAEHIAVSTPKQEEVLAFLQEIDSDVVPSLSSRTNLEDYSSKICRLSVCVVAWYENHIVGLSSAYCNDPKTRIGFLTLIAVAKDFRCQGIATDLLDETIRVAKSKNMKKLILETNINNKRAISLYIKRGFKIAKNEQKMNPTTAIMECALD